MKIFIIRDGKQTGPYEEDAVQTLLSQGSVLPKDKGWRKGLPGWLPLSDVLKPDSELSAHPPEPPGSTGRAGTNGSGKNGTSATAKQKALLKYLGVQSIDGVSKEEAAVVISDALENPKFQSRMHKWQDEKLRLHPDTFQDEIDFRKTNRTNRYLEFCQTDGAEVVKDVTKAHVQVLVESLDKRFPNWESDPRAALWDYLFPSIGEHFPTLVLPAAKGKLRLGGMPKMVSALARKPTVGLPTIATPPSAPGAFSAALRGIVYGAIVLGLIVAADHFFGQDHFMKFLQTGPGKPISAPPPVQPAEPPKAAPSSVPPEPPVVAAKAPENPPAGIPELPPLNPPAVPPVPAEPAPAPPAPIAPPMIAENKPPAAEKPAVPPAPVPPEIPAPAAVAPPVPLLAPPPLVAPAAPVVPGAQRAVITLTQAITVTLQNGQITLPAGTQLRNLAIEGQNVRVSWNNNLFYVPAMATDVNSPTPFPVTPAATPSSPSAPSVRPATPGVPAKPLTPRKPGDDL